MTMLFFTSDNHFAHRNIIKYCGRPYASISEHDAALVDNWNSVVGDSDEVWILGDFSFADPRFYLDRLKGRKRLIRGNHDYKNWKAMPWEPPIVELRHEGRMLVLCHYPLMSWRASSHRHTYHLHGHCHGKLKHSGLALDVGVDAWGYKPVSFEEVVRVLDAKRDVLNGISAASAGPT